ncbi:MAG: polymer-forming cytoskeletal protein [Calditrichaeota bacterium]|nr:polymer-forming cytoskeletal protein [Calditrichota bacterium]
MAFKAKNSGTMSNELNFIGSGTFLEGLIETSGSLRVDGRVKGTIKSNDSVTIGSAGEVVGDVYARNAIIGGKVEGNVIVQEKLILESTSILNGNLRAGKLIIDEGALFNGKSEMGEASGQSGDKKFKLKPATEAAPGEGGSGEGSQ